MEWLKTFSSDYANAVTAFSALGALTLAAVTLWYLRREYAAKYRPYVVAVVHAEPLQGSLGCSTSIRPINVGSHPCKVKLTDIALQVGDETHTTPSNEDWLLIGSQGVGVTMPSGWINDVGVTNVREGRYRSNRIELRFVLHAVSTEGEHLSRTENCYEINVLGESPMVLFRPEWRK